LILLSINLYLILKLKTKFIFFKILILDFLKILKKFKITILNLKNFLKLMFILNLKKVYIYFFFINFIFNFIKKKKEILLNNIINYKEEENK